MTTPFALDEVLAVGVDPHRESLDVVGIHFPEEIVLDEAFDNTRAGHRALWSGAQALAAEHDLRLILKLAEHHGVAATWEAVAARLRQEPDFDGVVLAIAETPPPTRTVEYNAAVLRLLMQGYDTAAIAVELGLTSCVHSV